MVLEGSQQHAPVLMEPTSLLGRSKIVHNGRFCQQWVCRKQFLSTMIGPLLGTMNWYIRTYILNAQGKGVDANDRDLINFVLKLYSF